MFLLAILSISKHDSFYTIRQYPSLGAIVKYDLIPALDGLVCYAHVGAFVYYALVNRLCLR